MNKDRFIKQMKASSKLIECDLVIRNITIVDVFNKDTYVDSVAIKDGYIVGIGSYDAPTIIDGYGKYICPGLIDAHCHIESSLVTPKEYSKAAIRNGITSAICDPHEIANVIGTCGIDYMLNSSSNLPFDFYFMLPSCVPGTDFENSGAKLFAEDLNKYYENPKVLGLAEVMNAPAVYNAEESMVNKLFDSISFKKIIDGHGAGINPMMVNSYRTANITTDHECITASEAMDKLRKGMHILIREGTVAKNLNELLPAVTESNSSRFSFCSDDKHIDDLMINGSINYSIKASIKYGLKPETAISLGTINTALLYNIKNKGAIAPGYIADFIILNDLNSFSIDSVYKEGILVSNNHELTDSKLFDIDSDFNITENSIKIPEITLDTFNIDIQNNKSKKLNVIEIIPNKLESRHLKLDLNNINSFEDLAENDYSKIAVIERHNNTGNIGLGVLKGLGIENGAIATTIAHDSHNLIIAGTNDSDMFFAAKELEKMHGGIIVLQDSKIIAKIQLEICGLMTSRSYTEIESDLNRLHEAIKIIAPSINFNPFLTLSFLSLPVIPELKITDKGIFDVTQFKFIDLFE